MKQISKEDFDHVLFHTKELWKTYFAKESTIFITGGTGFFGKWLLETFIHINEKLNLDGKVIVLSRNPEKFLNEFSQFSIPSIKFIKGDILSFSFPEDKIDYIIHAAVESSVQINMEHPLFIYNLIVESTKKVLELAKEKKVKALLYTSSGSVYGKQPFELTHIPEEFTGSPDIYSEDAAFGEGKRVAEMLCNFYYKKHGVPSKIARCFAFGGPYFSSDSRYAFGSFMKNALEENVIKINGDGTPYRSYMYPSDLCIWLWTMLFAAPACRPYNIGSEEDISILDLAKLISLSAGKKNHIKIEGASKSEKPSRYVPSTKRAEEELKLTCSIDIKEALRKTFLFYNYDDKS